MGYVPQLAMKDLMCAISSCCLWYLFIWSTSTSLLINQRRIKGKYKREKKIRLGLDEGVVVSTIVDELLLLEMDDVGAHIV